MDERRVKLLCASRQCVTLLTGLSVEGEDQHCRPVLSKLSRLSQMFNTSITLSSIQFKRIVERSKSNKPKRTLENVPITATICLMYFCVGVVDTTIIWTRNSTMLLLLCYVTSWKQIATNTSDERVLCAVLMFPLPCLCFMVQHKWLMVVAIVFLYAYDAAYLYPPPPAPP